MYIVQLYCSELLLLKKLHLLVGLNRTPCPVLVVRISSIVRIPDRSRRALPLGSYARTPVERYEMWFEIIYWQPCNFCFAYMPGRPKGSVSCLAWAWQPRWVGQALCVQPPVAPKRSITQKNTQNTSKSILESNRMKKPNVSHGSTCSLEAPCWADGSRRPCHNRNFTDNWASKIIFLLFCNFEIFLKKMCALRQKRSCDNNGMIWYSMNPLKKSITLWT